MPKARPLSSNTKVEIVVVVVSVTDVLVAVNVFDEPMVVVREAVTVRVGV